VHATPLHSSFPNIVDMRLCRKQLTFIFTFLLLCLVMTVSAKGGGGGRGGGGGGGGRGGGSSGGRVGGGGNGHYNSASKSVGDSKIGQAIFLTLGAYAIQQMMIHQV
jgi:hypothetical protein